MPLKKNLKAKTRHLSGVHRETHKLPERYARNKRGTHQVRVNYPQVTHKEPNIGNNLVDTLYLIPLKS